MFIPLLFLLLNGVLNNRIWILNVWNKGNSSSVTNTLLSNYAELILNCCNQHNKKQAAPPQKDCYNPGKDNINKIKNKWMWRLRSKPYGPRPIKLSEFLTRQTTINRFFKKRKLGLLQNRNASGFPTRGAAHRDIRQGCSDASSLFPL